MKGVVNYEDMPLNISCDNLVTYDNYDDYNNLVNDNIHNDNEYEQKNKMRKRSRPRTCTRRIKTRGTGREKCEK